MEGREVVYHAEKLQGIRVLNAHQLADSKLQVSTQNIDELADHFTTSVYPSEWYNAQFERTKIRLNELLEDPNAVLIFDGERLIGGASWKIVGVRKDGKNVVETGTAVVSPDYMGNGLGSLIKYKLEEAISAYFETSDNDYVLIVVSKNPGVIAMAEKTGYLRRPFMDVFSEYGDPRIDSVTDLEQQGFSLWELDFSEDNKALDEWREKTRERFQSII